MAEPATEIYIANASGHVTGTRTVEPPRTPEVQRIPSRFENIMNAIRQLESQPPSLGRDAALEDAIGERDHLLELANRPDLELFDPAKGELMGIYHDARVKVTNKEKEGKEEYEGRGKLQKLQNIQELVNELIINPNRNLDQAERALLQSRVFQGETRNGFWSSPRVREIEQNLGLNQGDLERTYGGAVDYFYRESLDMIVEVVKDRRKYRSADDPYPNNGLDNIWNGIRFLGMDGVVVDETGHPLYDEEGEIVRVSNFDELREAIETERRKDPYVSSRDYETWIQFVADDEDELEEMIPDIAKKIIRNLGTGEPQSIYNGVEEEKKKMDKALAYFKFRSEARRRRVRSSLTDENNGLAGERLSRIARKSVDPYFNYAEFLASACEDTRDRDHLVDSWFLDRNGENLAALELYSGSLPPDELLPPELVNNQQFIEDIKDGGVWRYGKNHRLTNKILEGSHDMGALERRQQLIRKRFENILMGLKLRSMTDLLNLDDKGVPQGDPSHPAFQRLKVELDRKDQEDITKYRHIRDADENPTTQTRWQEYCLKAYLWGKEGKLGDPRTRPRVIFQHPLAHSPWPKGFTDEDGNIISPRSEFWDMYEKDPRQERWFFDSKRRRLRQIVGPSSRAERILTNFQMDVTAGGPRIILEVQKDGQGNLVSSHGEIVPDPNDPNTKRLQITPNLTFAINFDANGNPFVEDVVPEFVLMRTLSQQALKEDQAHVISLGQEGERRRRFKIFHHIRNKLRIPIDSPLFAGWYEGAHDTLRPVLLKYSYDIPGLRQWFDELATRGAVPLVDGRLDKEDGMDEKGTMANWAEFERRFKLALAYAVRKKWRRHFNFPGHQTPDGGNKEMRNANEPARGISSYTVTTTRFIEELLSPCKDLGNEFGCTGDGMSPITQLIGLWKGPNEAVFGESGYSGFIVNPRDPESWVKRAKGNFSLMGIYTSGDPNNPNSHGLLNDGLFSGVFHLRTIARAAANYDQDATDEYWYKNPFEAYNALQESAYDRYVDAAARVAAPFMQAIHQFYKSEESNFGRNPESAKFMATMFWYSVSSWMDREWSEYRGVYGFAYDGVLPLARIFMHTVLKESALIYTDQQWDEIMLGYSRVEYEDGTVERIIRYKVDDQDNTVERLYNEVKKTERDVNTIQAGGTRILYKVDEGGNEKEVGRKQVRKVEVHEGILDAVPEKLKKEIIERNNNHDELIKWLPFGINSYRPETLEVMKKFKEFEPSARTQAIYKVVAENLEAHTQPRRKVSRAGIAVAA